MCVWVCLCDGKWIACLLSRSLFLSFSLCFDEERISRCNASSWMALFALSCFVSLRIASCRRRASPSQDVLLHCGVRRAVERRFRNMYMYIYFFLSLPLLSPPSTCSSISLFLSHLCSCISIFMYICIYIYIDIYMCLSSGNLQHADTKPRTQH